jgi:hypothetical protein
MKRAELSTRTNVIKHVAQLFDSARPDEPFILGLHEDLCFEGSEWLNIAEVTLHPELTRDAPSSDEAIHFALQYGFYECRFHDYETILSDLRRLLGLESATESQNQILKAAESLRSLALICTRLGLIHPTLDADALARMPFRRPTTVIADTTAVIQGALDFVVRFLSPAARVKVPAIVHMEILNNSDAYMKFRRSKASVKKGEAIYHHAIGQGGQRVLLRLELQTDTEVERTSIFSDPLRNAFTQEKATDARDLNISAPIRGYCDRLILETARQHQSHSSPGHPVWIMTSDQGLARMALAEGIDTLFYRTPGVEDVCGQTFAGTCLHPFSGTLYSVPLVDLLWEVAVTFGSARLSYVDDDREVRISAMGEKLGWQPFHSKDDLLWFESHGSSVDDDEHATNANLLSPRLGHQENSHSAQTVTHRSTHSAPPLALSGAYRFSVDSMLTLMASLHQNSELSEKQAARSAGVHPTQLSDYRNFLLAAELVEIRETAFLKTDQLDQLWTQLELLNLKAVSQAFMLVPSFNRFIQHLCDHRPCNNRDRLPIAQRAYSTYVALAEICGLALPISSEGVYSTLASPETSNFVDLAVEIYESLRREDAYVSTGAWLEELARAHEVHPILARDLLEAARNQGMLQRYTEGATPDTRFERHILRTLERGNGPVKVRVVHLYHGDFLIPGKASVSLKLERAAK